MDRRQSLTSGDAAAEARAHWERIYQSQPANTLSWHKTDHSLSLAMIAAGGAGPGASVLDVGGGASTLVDNLLAKGFHPGVLDIAGSALRQSIVRLGNQAGEVEWFETDVMRFASPHPWDVWHDRAVFHFLTDRESRATYSAVASRSVRPEGAMVIATFAPTGPERCSGLPTVRYSSERLAEELGEDFRLELEREETHQTPSGRDQDFLYCLFRRRPL